MGIKEVISAPRKPWQNPFVERIIGSIRLNTGHLKIVHGFNIDIPSRLLNIFSV